MGDDMNVWMDWYKRTEGTMRLPDASLREVEALACDECGAKLFPGDWLTTTGCTYCGCIYCDEDEVLL
jgi:hypothetical protein